MQNHSGEVPRAEGLREHLEDFALRLVFEAAVTLTMFGALEGGTVLEGQRLPVTFAAGGAIGIRTGSLISKRVRQKRRSVSATPGNYT